MLYSLLYVKIIIINGYNIKIVKYYLSYEDIRLFIKIHSTKEKKEYGAACIIKNRVTYRERWFR